MKMKRLIQKKLRRYSFVVIMERLCSGSSNKELKDFFEVLDFIGVDFSDELETVFDLLLEIDDFEETRCFFHPDEELVVF
jgi:hypothetical protein